MESNQTYLQWLRATSFADLIAIRDEAEKRFNSCCEEGVLRKNTESLADFERRLLSIHDYQLIVIAANTEIGVRLENTSQLIKNRYDEKQEDAGQ